MGVDLARAAAAAHVVQPVHHHVKDPMGTVPQPYVHLAWLGMARCMLRPRPNTAPRCALLLLLLQVGRRPCALAARRSRLSPRPSSTFWNPSFLGFLAEPRLPAV